MDRAFLAGLPQSSQLPLARFLPPLPQGMVQAWLKRADLLGETLLDPFGSSPQLALEAAASGCAVVAAVNNPITRFVLERRLDPLSPGELQAALSKLASAAKDSDRLESFVLGLYRSVCARCGGDVTADYFVWKADEARPVLKGYACQHCGHAGEDPADEADVQLAGSYSGRGLARAQALEDLAPVGDPARAHAEAALDVYPGRALFALTTLVHKAHQLRLEGREAVALRALLLSAFDAADNMWAHPEGRERPKQLSPSPDFLETNVWRALERGVEAWEGESPGVAIGWWPEGGAPAPSTVSIFAGTVRDLAETLPGLPGATMLTVPPRPNQAYWTLSALWTAWLWGREAAEPIRAALRRRRYDWNWHADALRKTASHLTHRAPQVEMVGMFVPEAEPRFLAACLIGFDAAGWKLDGIALRVDEAHAQLQWAIGAASGQAQLPTLEFMLEEAIEERGEPTPFPVLLARAASELAGQNRFQSSWDQSAEAPVSRLQGQVDNVLKDPRRFVRMDKRQDPERGIYWLTQAPEGVTALSDRIERKVIEVLRRHQGLSLLQFDRELCRHFKGLQTPDHGFLRACLESYGEADERGQWTLRPEDESEARQRDMDEIRSALHRLGDQLGFRVSGQDPVQWAESGSVVQSFCVLETAILADAPSEEEGAIAYVIPGGRASLVAEKARRDPRLQQNLSTGLIVIKFRHIRRLLNDSNLSRDILWDRLTIDPPEHQDPQLPLL